MDEYSKTHKYWYPRGATMQIEVTGHRSRKFKELISEAAEFYCSKLLSKRMLNSLYVEIQLKKKLHDDEDYQAFCDYQGKSDGIREFTVELKKGMSIRDTLTYLAHECVHVKQFATGEMKNGAVYAVTTRWKGKEINDNAIDYWDLPWEIEAYGREKGLYSRFVVTKKLNENKEFLDSIVF